MFKFKNMYDRLNKLQKFRNVVSMFGKGIKLIFITAHLIYHKNDDTLVIFKQNHSKSMEKYFSYTFEFIHNEMCAMFICCSMLKMHF